MAHPLDQALADLSRERQTVAERLVALDTAIRAVRAAMAVEGPTESVRSRGRTGPSLRAVVVELLRDYPNGATATQITNILIKRGDPRIKAGGLDPGKPVRTALWTANKAGEVLKYPDGTWRAVTPEMVRAAISGQQVQRDELVDAGVRSAFHPLSVFADESLFEGK